jgi:DNA (cytosine-5)-methyltransferase 1
VIAVENVPEMLRWTLYRAWRMALTDLGYRVSEQVLDAADCGTPQERARLIVVASRTRRPIFVAPGREPRIAARSCIDLDGGTWTPTAQWCERSRARIARAQDQHGDDVLVPYYGSTQGGRSLDRPIGTLTTVDRYALVRADRGRMLSVDEMRRLSGFPAGYVLTGTKREQTAQLGNAVPPPLARHVVRTIMEVV